MMTRQCDSSINAVMSNERKHKKTHSKPMQRHAENWCDAVNYALDEGDDDDDDDDDDPADCDATADDEAAPAIVANLCDSDKLQMLS